MWWQDVLWGFWNGLTAWAVLLVHAFGGWDRYPFYNLGRAGNWYDLGFLLGVGSWSAGPAGGGIAKRRGRQRREV